MRNFTFKRQLLFVMFMLLGCLSIQAADDGLVTKQITIKLDKAGTLPDRISESKKNLITNLKIVGEVNGTDWKFIREMAGCDYDMNITDGKLSILDLSDAKIVEGGSDYWEGSYTSNDNLGDHAFYGCTGLTSLTIPSSVTSIGDYAFYECCGLTSLSIPSSVTSIGYRAFFRCTGLTSLTIPSSITSIGVYAFSNCTGLTSLSIPSSVTSIGANAFSNCSGLTSLTIPSSVTSIGICAFSNCTGLTSLSIPSSVTSIGYSAFQGCSGLTSLSIPSSVTSIDWGTFFGCSGLTSLSIPSSVISIGKNAFNGCCGLASLSIPSSVTSIGDYAFEGCSGLTSIYAYPEKLPKLGTGVFYRCDAKNCTVYVPIGTFGDYWLSEFGYFENIVEFDATGIDKVTTSTDAKELSRYSVNGQRLSAPAKGLNIVKYSDGSVKKVAVQ